LIEFSFVLPQFGATLTSPRGELSSVQRTVPADSSTLKDRGAAQALNSTRICSEERWFSMRRFEIVIPAGSVRARSKSSFVISDQPEPSLIRQNR
jgi:hypothetical protein